MPRSAYCVLPNTWLRTLFFFFLDLFSLVSCFFCYSEKLVGSSAPNTESRETKSEQNPQPVSSSKGCSSHSGEFLPWSCTEQPDLSKKNKNDFLLFHSLAPILFHAKANKCIYYCLTPSKIMYSRLKSQFRSQQVSDSNAHYISGGQCSSREAQK